MGREEDIVRRHLGRDRFNSVRVESDVNVDGENIVRITIIYESLKERVSVKEMSAITDDLWSQSLKDGGSSFPVPRFVSSADVGGLRPA